MTVFTFYLLKVVICSGVLYLYYYLALRNKLFHQWNRFYLLAAILISLVAPIVQVTIMHSAEQPAKAIEVLQVFQSADGYLEEVTIGGGPSISTDQWLMMAYSIISALFLFSVLLSFQKIISLLRSHKVQWIEKIKFINTKAQGTPFSFFNFIFWNEEIDLQTETGQQIFEHELVHIKERHSFDKLFIQMVLIVFWCNPFFWLIRRELKLIHEFIADKKAVGEHGTAALAAMILNASYPAHFNSLTNHFFQTSIKRRIAMLAKIQNPRINYLSRILALSIVIVTVLAFTVRAKGMTTIPAVKLNKPITVVIDAGHGIMANGKFNGAVVDNISEDAIVLAIAAKVKELNTNGQIKIVLTRPAEQITDLHKRVDIARENNADLFLSLHVNAYNENAEPGTRSEKELKSGFGVYVSNKQTAFQQQSEILGSVLSQELNSIYPTNPFLLKRQVGIWVLDQNVCPSVLLECGYLTDKKDREFISKKENQTAVAQKILIAVQQYALHIENKSLPSQVTDTIPKKENTNSNTDKNVNGINLNLAGSPLYILDGKEVTKAGALKIAPTAIQSVNVLKGKQATDKYGKEGANGVIEIISKSNGESNLNRNSDDKTGDNHLALNYFQPDPLIIVDGEEVTKDEMQKLEPSSIEKINVLKDKSAEDKYGAKGKNGVIEITTKKANGISNEITITSDNRNYYDTVPKNQIFTKVETEASVDKEQWRQFLQKNLQSVIEQTAIKGAKPGTYTVKVRFLVRKDGSISDFIALNDPGYGLAKKVEAIMKESPVWNPGLQNGKPVNSYHTQPITFVIQEQ